MNLPRNDGRVSESGKYIEPIPGSGERQRSAGIENRESSAHASQTRSRFDSQPSSVLTPPPPPPLWSAHRPRRSGTFSDERGPLLNVIVIARYMRLQQVPKRAPQHLHPQLRPHKRKTCESEQHELHVRQLGNPALQLRHRLCLVRHRLRRLWPIPGVPRW